MSIINKARTEILRILFNKEFSFIDIVLLFISLLLGFAQFYDLFIVFFVITIIVRYLEGKNIDLFEDTWILTMLLLGVIYICLVYQKYGAVLSVQYSKYFQHSTSIINSIFN